MASVEEVLHDLGSLVGYHSNKHHQAAADDRLRPNGESSTRLENLVKQTSSPQDT